jgi:hypothetical protein
MADKASDLWQIVTDLATRYGERDNWYDELEEYYFLEGQQEDAIRREEGIETVRQPHITNAVDLLCDLAADAGYSLSVPASDKATEKKAAESAELWLRAVLEEQQRVQHSNLLSRAAWLVAMRGAVAARVIYLPDRVEESVDEETGYAIPGKFPLLVQLRDPRYVWPRFGVDGLDCVVERWSRTVADVRQTWGKDMLAGRKDEEDCEWTEYWDGSQYCYWADGQVVSKKSGKEKGRGPWPHGLGCLPWVYEFSRQTGMTADPMKRVRPLPAGVRGVVDHMNVLDSAALTAVVASQNSAWMVQSAQDGFKLDLTPGAVNYLLPDEKVESLRRAELPRDIDPMRTQFSTQLERGTWPATMYGAYPGNVAGYLVVTLNRAALAKLRPYITGLEALVEGVCELLLELSVNVLAPLVGNTIPVWTVAGQGRDRARVETKLDTRSLPKPYRVECSLGEVLAADEAGNLQMARMATDGDRPLLSQETARERYKLADDPGLEADRIAREQAMMDPEVMDLRMKIQKKRIMDELEVEAKKAGLVKVPVEQGQPEQAAGYPGELLPPTSYGAGLAGAPVPSGGTAPAPGAVPSGGWPVGPYTGGM